ncbi:MAG TPA: hypothetical protein VK203_03155 [Nostocaceae cyanobacterium]|nr:hypothetical protein [Nostocaceae cyanobacterium]
MTRDNERRRRSGKRNQPSPKSYQKKPPFWKEIMIQVLRGTSGILENAAVKLETETPSTAKNTPGLRGWGKFLNQVRLFLPSSVSNSLSDTVLTGILAIFAVGIVGISSFFWTGKPAEIATLPPVEEVPTPTPTVTASPESLPVVEVTPTPQAKVTPSPIPDVTVTPEPTSKSTQETTPETTPIPTQEPQPKTTPTPTQETTPELTSTSTQETQPEPIPTPVIELTPEEALIAEIQNQVVEISDRISVNLIKSIQANFRTSDLIINISDAWYTLEKSQQDKLSREILQRSQQLDFTHLELFDSQNRLIARSPVVGNEMVIYKRQIAIKN